MAFHDESPVSINQLQTPSNQGARDAAMGGFFPGPIAISQQFSIQAGQSQLNSRESDMLQRVVNRLKRQRDNVVVPRTGLSAGIQFGRAFGA